MNLSKCVYEKWTRGNHQDVQDFFLINNYNKNYNKIMSYMDFFVVDKSRELWIKIKRIQDENQILAYRIYRLV